MPVVLPPELKAHLDLVRGRVEDAEQSCHDHHRLRWDDFDALWHSYNDTKAAYQNSRTDLQKKQSLWDAREVFGDGLFIPHTFAAVENLLPRWVSSRPRGVVNPRRRASEENVGNMRATVEAQQSKMGLELTLQDIARSGAQFGLGVGKMGWRCRTRDKHVLVNQGQAEWARSIEPEQRTLYDDPWFEFIDPVDWIWDPYGSDLQSVGWVVHRAWRSHDYVLEKLGLLGSEPDPNAPWQLTPGLTKEEVQGASSVEKYSTVWAGRLRNRGYAQPKPSKPIHEILEYHDGRQVITVLDRFWPVARTKTHSWHGELPFVIFRPTKVLSAMVGKGTVESMEELQHETNMARTDRRWNALLKLHQSFAYREDAIDVGDIAFAPGLLIPVSNADPSNVLAPLVQGDIPSSAYQETDELRADTDRVIGMNDTATGQDVGGNMTATGIQMALAQANVRLQLTTHRLEWETVKPAVEQQIELNQQHIRGSREYRLPNMDAGPQLPAPGEPDRRWSWFSVGPAELAGEFEFEVEGGSMSPQAQAEKRAGAQVLLGLSGRQGVDERKLTQEALRALGYDNPSLLMAPDQPPVPASVIDALKQALEATGGDSELVDAVVAAQQRQTGG